MTHPLSRRELLVKLGQGATLAALAADIKPTYAAPPPAPSPTIGPGPLAPSNKKLGYAVVGLGSLALRQILPGFAQAKNSKPVALVSGHRSKAESVAAQYDIPTKNIYNYENYDTIKDNPDVDVIYIVLPNGMHAEYTIRGAKAGKHILCEKPMASTPQECREMIAACKAANRKLMIAYRCQYEPHNLEAMRLARSGELGKVQTIVADHGFRAGDPAQWRLHKALSGGGSLMDIGIYSLQAARYITGEEPTEISAFLWSPPNDPRFREVEANINFMLRFPSGALANCTSSYNIAWGNHYRVVGDRNYFDLEPATLYDGIQLTVGSENGPPAPRQIADIDQFATEMDHMSLSVINNKTPHTPGEEGLRDLTYIAAIYEAARTGKVVKIV